MYDFQRKHGHDIDCHVLAPASTCSNTPASTWSTTRASMVLNGVSTCSNTCASTCITTRASTCHYTCARLLFKNMHPGGLVQRRLQVANIVAVIRFNPPGPSAFPYATKYGTPGCNSSFQSFSIIFLQHFFFLSSGQALAATACILCFLQEAHCVPL